MLLQLRAMVLHILPAHITLALCPALGSGSETALRHCTVETELIQGCEGFFLNFIILYLVNPFTLTNIGLHGTCQRLHETCEKQCPQHAVSRSSTQLGDHQSDM